MPVPVRVVIVEDHEMVRDGFEMVMAAADDIEVVGTADSLEAGRKLIADLQPDVVVCDFMLPDGSGAEIAESVSSEHTKVLIVTGADDRRAVEAAVASGCAGFVSKGRSAQDLLGAVRSVAGGAAVFPANLLAAVTQPGSEPRSSDLTKRELEILQLLARARNAEEIATDLFLSVHTVRNHIRAVLTKLEARSQLEALVTGIRQGLVTIDMGDGQ